MKTALPLIGLCACAGISRGAELSPRARRAVAEIVAGIHVDAASTTNVIVEANVGFDDGPAFRNTARLLRLDVPSVG